MNIYEYQRLVGKIEDCAEMREAFIKIFDQKTKKDMALWGLLYARRILEVLGTKPCNEIGYMFEAVQEWLDGKTNYHKPRTVAGKLYELAYKQTEYKLKKFYQTMANISAIPHVKAHALWASDMAITMINQIYPDDLDAVKKERQIQIALLKQVK